MPRETQAAQPAVGIPAISLLMAGREPASFRPTSRALPRIYGTGAATRRSCLVPSAKASPSGIESIRRILCKASCLLLSLAAIAWSCCLVASPSRAKQEKQEDERSPAPEHYVRTLGPFSIDGRNFTVKLSVNCYKESRHAGMCDENDQEAVKSMKIVDNADRTCFSRSFPIGYLHQLERHVVDATLLEGREHGALEITYTKLPSHANTGVTIQLFAIRDGALQPLNPDPLPFYGQLGELPPGPQKNSRMLLAGDVLPIYVLTNYFYVVCPVRVNWKEFDLDQQETGEFDVVHQPPYGRKPDIEAPGFIHLYSSPDTNASPRGIDVTAQSHVEVLKALFRKGPPEAHDSPSDTWLEISVDGKVGWIVGLDDYTAVGLSPAE
jgi:hypothetical protein